MAIPSTMIEQIEFVDGLEISYRMLHNEAILNDINSNKKIEIPFVSLVNKYKYVLTDIVVKVKLDDILARQYLYQPKMLSYDLYGTTELWAELLRLNHCSSISEFKPTNIRIYNPSKLKSMINEILILEKKID